MRMSKFFFQLVIVIHVFACSWYFVACPLNECSDSHSWVVEQGRYPCGSRSDMVFKTIITLFKDNNLLTGSPFSIV